MGKKIMRVVWAMTAVMMFIVALFVVDAPDAVFIVAAWPVGIAVIVLMATAGIVSQ